MGRLGLTRVLQLMEVLCGIIIVSGSLGSPDI
ncbi:hypothetical protein Goarm_012814 [Gossypium armourianum]|uniref:Uncharacterized protein n=1 Tax=Gossypium armourianum TaxID=34283 RepID=A0A7J9J3U0_9ROSI|nr:hypothetical protein [Gossypium armourianum]